MQFKKIATFAALACVAAFTSVVSHADTLKLVSTGGGSTAGVDVYPYNFSVNGSSTTTSLLCIDLNREVTVGEQWNVSTSTISDSTSDEALREDAWLLTQFGKINPKTGVAYTNSEVQFAVWDVLDPSGISSNAAYSAAFDSASAYLVNQAIIAADNVALYDSGFFSSFILYSPTSNTSGWTKGTPQRFLGDPATVAATPEPSSLLLMGTGLFGAGFMVMRRRTLQEQM